ncbi:LysR family transcriptional regulator [Mesorhizobium sp. M1365]|uniref:LysR family transcriptional regulator n=1 Tax=Mesorhizobium sp. M1365 TaxID=2957090 RepID=UPI00333BB293
MFGCVVLEELKTLALFAEEGSIQKVAQRLPLTQPAVTRQIQRLEEMLGTELLDRRLKPSRLTPAGVEVLARGKDILAAVDALRSFAKGDEPGGLLRLGLAHGLCDKAVAAAIGDAVARFPKVSLRLKSGWSLELADQHKRGQLDLAVILDGSNSKAGDGVVGTEALGVIAAESTVRQADVKTMPWILSPEPCDARRRLAAALAEGGHRLMVGAEIQDSALQIDWVRRGQGLGLLPRRLLREKLPQGIALVDAPGLELSLRIVVLRSPHLHLLREVADAVTEAVTATVRTD